jgi:hypothetical protein
MAVRGVQQLIATLAMLVGNYESFDQAKALLPARLLSAFELDGDRATVETHLGPGAADFDLVIAGISETCGPDSFLIASHGAHGIDPYTLFDPGRALVLPDHQQAPFLVSEFFPDDDAIDRFDPIIGGRRLMGRQREIRQVPYGTNGAPRCEMGGFAQLTTIRDYHRLIETRVIHRWTDEIGTWIGTA